MDDFVIFDYDKTVFLDLLNTSNETAEDKRTVNEKTFDYINGLIQNIVSLQQEIQEIDFPSIVWELLSSNPIFMENFTRSEDATVGIGRFMNYLVKSVNSELISIRVKRYISPYSQQDIGLNVNLETFIKSQAKENCKNPDEEWAKKQKIIDETNRLFPSHAKAYYAALAAEEKKRMAARAPQRGLALNMSQDSMIDMTIDCYFGKNLKERNPSLYEREKQRLKGAVKVGVKSPDKNDNKGE